MTDMDKIMDGLIRRTEDGTLKWDTGETSDEFVVRVDPILVRLRRFEPDDFATEDRYRLDILDHRDATVAALETNDPFGFVPNERRATDEQARRLDRLFVLVRRSVLNTQAVLEKLADALGAD